MRTALAVLWLAITLTALAIPPVGVLGPLTFALEPQAARANETMYFDTWEGTDDGIVGPAFSTTILGDDPGDYYLILMQGTYSLWSADQWGDWIDYTGNAEFACRGQAEESPYLPSPLTENGAVGLDPFSLFAGPIDSHVCPDGVGYDNLPTLYPSFQFSLDGGASWETAVPLNYTPNPDHVYAYLVHGDGHPLGIRRLDYPSSDNYGVLRIDIGHAGDAAIFSGELAGMVPGLEKLVADDLLQVFYDLKGAANGSTLVAIIEQSLTGACGIGWPIVCVIEMFLRFLQLSSIDDAIEMLEEVKADPPRFDYNAITPGIDEAVCPASSSIDDLLDCMGLVVEDYTLAFEYLITTTERHQGAVIDNDEDGMELQTQHLARVLAELVRIGARLADLADRLAAALADTAGDAPGKDWLGAASTSGLTGDERQALLDEGYSEEEIDEFEALLLSLPDGVDIDSYLAEFLSSFAEELRRAGDAQGFLIDEVEDALAALFPPPTCKGKTPTHIGTNGPDVIVGTSGPDVILAAGGDDAIYGLGGDDWICAGSGDDEVHGGSGRDRVWGQAGNDTLIGGIQNDRLRGGSGDDSLQGENGKRDRLFGGSGVDSANGGNGIADKCKAETDVDCEV